MPLGQDTLLGLAMRFAVKIDNGKYDLGSWSKAEGLEVSWELCEYRAGDSKNQRWYFPGHTKYSTVKLSRAATKDGTESVKEWLNSNSFKAEVQMGAIGLHDSTDTEITSWELVNVMPVKWNVAGFDATANKIAVETLELAHMGFLTKE